MSVSRSIICFGEMLLRLSASETDQELISSSHYSSRVAGAEANVAISLASLGLQSRMATILPDNMLGDRALKTLSDHGVNTGPVVRKPGRMGLFFLNSQIAGREGGLIYDREGSAFASAAPDEIDWTKALSNATWLHISGITAALGEGPLQALHNACTAAKDAGVKISFDCNYRPLLWQYREQEAPAILAALAQHADLLFAGPWDVSLMTGTPQSEEKALDAFESSAEAAFREFPNLAMIAATSRTIVGSEHHQLGAHIGTRSGAVHEPPQTINPVIDRIGSGDAFAAAVLYGVTHDWDATRIARFALQACVMKHAIHGDFSNLNAREVEAALSAE
ncbi:MAG: sugar kinase [Parasphingorhabdus sp.]